MDEQTRKGVDEACLRLLGWTDLEWWDKGAVPDIRGIHWAETGWYGRRAGGAGPAPSPSADSALVVPLAEALHDRGFLVRMFQTTTEGKRWSVSIVGTDDFGFLVAEESGDALPESLAKAAARAVEKSDG